MTTFPAPSFQPQVRVRPGRVARELRVEVVSTAKANHKWPAVRPEDAASIVRAPATLIAAGGWALPGEVPSASVVDVPTGVPNRESFALQLSPSTPDAAQTLVRAFAFLDVNGTKSVTSVSVVEVVPADESPASDVELQARHATTPTFALVGAPTGDHEAKRVQIHITLDRADDDPALEAIRSVFDAWASVLMLGGFAGPGIYPSAAGYVESVEPGLAHEVIVEIEHLFGTDATWDPIYRGLARIHADICPIREVRFQ